MAKNKFLTTNYNLNDENISIGHNNVFNYGMKNLAFGSSNNLPDVNGNIIFGSSNNSYDDDNIIFGSSNTLTLMAKKNIIFGDSHRIGNVNNIVFGQGHTIQGSYNFIAGIGHIVQTGGNVTIFGQYATTDDYLFAIGNGSVTKRQNALEVDRSGNLKIQGDLTTKDGKLSEIIENASNNKQDLEYLEKYGTTDVHVLQPGIDVRVDETGKVIIGTVSGRVLDLSGKVIAIPEGITEISRDSLDNSLDYLIYCEKCICPDSLVKILEGGIRAKEFKLNKNLTQLDLTDYGAISSYGPVKITISHNIKILGIGLYDSTLIFDENVNVVNCSISLSNCNIKVLNPHATLDFGFADACFFYGYRNSTLEELFKSRDDMRFANTFINTGSDCAPLLYSSTATEAILSANKYYTFTNISSLTVTLDTASATKLDEFMFSFETPADISSFSFGVLTDEGVEIKWIKEPNLKPNYIYEVSIVNGVGVIAGTAKEVAE